jgi:carboxylesterase
VLLIHGFTATTAEIRPLAKSLHGKGYTVAGPLLPGHGTKPEDINRYSWRDWIATAEAAYRQLSSRCERVYVGGESTGGLLALHLGSQHPEVAGILTYAPALKLLLTRWDLIKIYTFAPFITSVPKNSDDDDDGMAWQGYRENPLRGTIQLLRLQRQIYRRLPTIRRPLLIVQGRLDNTVSSDVPGIIAQRVRSSVKEIHWMDNSGHCVVLDIELDQVTQTTLGFLERTSV